MMEAYTLSMLQQILRLLQGPDTIRCVSSKQQNEQCYDLSGWSAYSMKCVLPLPVMHCEESDAYSTDIPVFPHPGSGYIHLSRKTQPPTQMSLPADGRAVHKKATSLLCSSPANPL